MKFEKKPRERNWPVAWTIIFVVNLPVCVFFGWMTTNGLARFGALVAMLAWWALGLWVCIRPNIFRRPLYLGAWALAVFQLVPVVHFIVGMIAGAIWDGLRSNVLGLDSLTARSDPVLRSVLDGLAVTLLTASALTLVALVLGAFLNLFEPEREESEQQVFFAEQRTFAAEQRRELVLRRRW